MTGAGETKQLKRRLFWVVGAVVAAVVTYVARRPVGAHVHNSYLDPAWLPGTIVVDPGLRHA